MFSLFMGRKLLFIAMIGLALAGVFGYYYYTMNKKNNKIIELQNKNIIQKVKINNLNTKNIQQKISTKNKIFSIKQKEIKKQIKKEIKNDDKNSSSDINNIPGTYKLKL